MFVSDSLEVDIPLAAAEHRILAFLRIGDLDRLAATAYGEGVTVLARAGFGGMAKQVAVHSLPAYRRGPVVVVPLRWTATGRMAAAFPVLDANLEMTASDEGTTLTLIGSYRPPLGKVGASIDRLVLRSVARATIRSFLFQLGGLATQIIPSRADPEPPTMRTTERG